MEWFTVYVLGPKPKAVIFNFMNMIIVSIFPPLPYPTIPPPPSHHVHAIHTQAEKQAPEVYALVD